MLLCAGDIFAPGVKAMPPDQESGHRELTIGPRLTNAFRKCLHVLVVVKNDHVDFLVHERSLTG